MIKNFVIAAVVSAAMFGTSWAFWQEPAPSRRAEPLRLQQQGVRALSTNQVAEKLGLSQAQRDEIAKLNQRGSVFGGGRDRDRTTNPSNPNVPAPERFQQALDEANKRAAENREKILTVLTPEQKAKWSEMTGEAFKFASSQRSVPRGTGTRSSEPAKAGAENKDQLPRQRQKTWQEDQFGKNLS